MPKCLSYPTGFLDQWWWSAHLKGMARGPCQWKMLRYQADGPRRPLALAGDVAWKVRSWSGPVLSWFWGALRARGARTDEEVAKSTSGRAAMFLELSSLPALFSPERAAEAQPRPCIPLRQRERMHGSRRATPNARVRIHVGASLAPRRGSRAVRSQRGS